MKSIGVIEDIRRQILNAMLLIAAGASVMAMTVNAVNQRPWENLVFPGVLCILVLGLFYLSTRKGERGYHISKYIALVLINLLYIPAAWLTSPGSTSAMPFYALAIFLFGLLLAVHNWEYVFSAITLAEVLVLFQIEGFRPEWFDIYTDPLYRLFDLTINFTVVSGIVFVMIFILTHYYKTQNDQLYHMSVTDALTGLYNRRYMMSTLEREHNVSERMGTSYTVVMIDINNFKRVNDTFGHLEGDALLRALGTILQSESRNYDVCCRYGGDEFLIILPRATKEEAAHYVDRMQTRFAEHTQRYQALEVSLSIGVVERDQQSLKEIIAIADNRLYARKAGL